jgi:hypothetical protein
MPLVAIGWFRRRIAVRGSVTYFAVYRETHGMATYGIVSRVSPVHTAMRNCTRERGPFEVGNQVLISSHGKTAACRPAPSQPCT